MPSRTVEIILKASDQFSDATKKLQLQFAAAKIAADELNKSVEKLQKQHPGLNLDEAKAVAKALEDMKKQSEGSGEGFKKARESARLLTEELGIHLPRALSNLLAQSQLVGPALSAAFGVVAVVGFIEALEQIPKAIEGVANAFHGWDETAKAAFDLQHDRTEKAIEDTIKFKARLAELAVVSIDPFAGRRAGLALEITGQTQARDKAIDDRIKANDAIRQLGGNVSFMQAAIAGPLALAAKTFGEFSNVQGKGLAFYQESLKKANEDAQKADDALKGLNKELETLGAESARVAAVSVADMRRSLAASINLPLQGIAGFPRPAKPIVEPDFDPLTGQMYLKPTDETGRVDLYREQIDKMYRQINRFGFAPSELPLQPSALQPKPLVTPTYFESGAVHYPQLTPAGIVDPFAEMKFAEMKKFQDEFIDTFGKATGQVWDTFFEQGTDILTRLANVAKGWLKDIGKMAVENLATGLLFGSTKKSFGTELLGIAGGPFGLGGGLLSGVLGKAGGGLLGGLLGGGGAAAVSGTLAKGAIGIINPATGELVSGAAAGATGGLAGALGLGGGAGLLGLGAATLPVIGGALIAGIALAEIFGRHREAPFTRDPNAIQNTREYLFYTGATALADAAKDISNFTHKLNTLPTGALVKDGLPVALASSNQFRRDINATLQQDI